MKFKILTMVFVLLVLIVLYLLFGGKSAEVQNEGAAPVIITQ